MRNCGHSVEVWGLPPNVSDLWQTGFTARHATASRYARTHTHSLPPHSHTQTPTQQPTHPHTHTHTHTHTRNIRVFQQNFSLRAPEKKLRKGEDRIAAKAVSTAEATADRLNINLSNKFPFSTLDHYSTEVSIATTEPRLICIYISVPVDYPIIALRL